MAIGKIVSALNDFSAGEVDITAKRGNEPVTLTGARQALNWRLLNGHKKANRPGRSTLFFEGGRIDEVLMSPGNPFYLVFVQGFLRVYNVSGTQVFASAKKGDGTTNIPWTTATVKDIVWAATGSNTKSIYITYADDVPNNVPQILTWDGISSLGGWRLSTFAELVNVGQKRTPFYRLAALGITLQPSGVSGSVTITFSAPVLNTGMVGTRLRYCNQQLLITAVSNSTTGTATANQPIPPGQSLTFGASTGGFVVGDIVIGSLSGAKGIVTATGASLSVQLIPNSSGTVAAFITDANENVSGPNGTGSGTTVAATLSPQAVGFWDQEVMGPYLGYPKSVFFDQARLGFCNFPALPSAIGWSAIGSFADFYPDATSADNAIFELAPGRCQIYYVVPGMESSEFVFCDNGVYYISITPQQPLKPGSVSFSLLSEEGAYPVQPRAAEQSIVYMKASGTQVAAIQAQGAYYRPYVVENVSQLHAHLFQGASPVSIAIPAPSAQFDELYIYILRSDGTVVVGKYQMKQGMMEPGQDGKPQVGWVPWNGNGVVNWVSALASNVIFDTTYAIPGGSAFSAVEQLDATQYLDNAIFVNNLPAALAAVRPLGKGPLWFMPGGSVELIDHVTRFMNTYQVDANGWIIPQNIGGENLNSASLVAGQPWTAIYEPFIPQAQPGQDVEQRMRRRRIVRVAVSVVNSTGFTIGTRRIPAYFIDDDPTQPAPLREGTFSVRPRGRTYDPRIVLTKDTPGPLTVLEYGIESTV